jgi:hypothetical protein
VSDESEATAGRRGGGQRGAAQAERQRTRAGRADHAAPGHPGVDHVFGVLVPILVDLSQDLACAV